jgi:hypothetical protein
MSRPSIGVGPRHHWVKTIFHLNLVGFLGVRCIGGLTLSETMLIYDDYMKLA